MLRVLLGVLAAALVYFVSGALGLPVIVGVIAAIIVAVLNIVP